MLEVKNLNKSYESGGRTYPVLQDVNFRVEKGAVHKTVYSSFFMLFSNCLHPSQLHYFFFLRFSCVAATIFLDC